MFVDYDAVPRGPFGDRDIFDMLRSRKRPINGRTTPPRSTSFTLPGLTSKEATLAVSGTCDRLRATNARYHAALVIGPISRSIVPLLAPSARRLHRNQLKHNHPNRPHTEISLARCATSSRDRSRAIYLRQAEATQLQLRAAPHHPRGYLPAQVTAICSPPCPASWGLR